MSIETTMERIEQELREELLDGGYFDLYYRKNRRPVRTVYDSNSVVTAMFELDSNTFDAAVMLSGKDPIEAAKALAELMGKAVNHVIVEAPIRAAAEYEIEISGRDAA